MLTVTPIRGSNQYAAAHYFSAADDYYSKEHAGEWQGAGAEALGLAGPVDQAQFARLLNGQLPNGEVIQTTFNKDENKKRMGLDLTFSPPKSVSLQALVAGDKGVVDAHDQAVSRALKKVEQLTEARKKVNGKSYRERTGNMVIGKFRHEMSRAKDPQLHTHAIVLNMTQRADGAWRALSNEDLFNVQHQIDAIYKVELAKELRVLGYEIRVMDDLGNFELAHISREQIEAFSARSRVIEEALANEGKTRQTATTLEKQIISLATRPRKDERERDLIKQYWVEKSRQLGINYGPRSRMDEREYGPVSPGFIPIDSPRTDPDSSGGQGPESFPAPPPPSVVDSGMNQSGDSKDDSSSNTGKVPGSPPSPAHLDGRVPSGLAEPSTESGVPGKVTPGRPSSREPAIPSQREPTLPPDSPVGGALPKSLLPEQVIVQFAIQHLTEREAVVTESDLLAVAMRRAVGLVGEDEVRQEVGRLIGQGTLIEAPPTYRLADRKDGPAMTPAGWQSYLQKLKGWTEKQAQQYVRHAVEQGSLVPTEQRYTTQKGLQREKAILAIERAGRNQVTPILPVESVRSSLEGSTLNSGQVAAVEIIVSSPHRFVGIQGDAGVGKTFTVSQAVSLIRSAHLVSSGEGYRVVALAPYGNQAKALRDEGLEAHTLASFLKTKNKPIDSRTVIVLDETGVTGSRQMEQLLRIVEKSGARMVMLGDTKQTEAIEAGRPFAQLQQAGMTTVRISEIQRQKDPELKTAVQYAAEGEMAKSLEHVRHIEELPDPTQRHQAVVDDFMRLSASDRDKTLIVAGTNNARRQINGMVREALGVIGQGVVFDTLLRVDMTQAQRRYAPSYRPGMVIQPEHDYKVSGLKRGETYTVKESTAGNLLVLQRPDGSTTSINPRKVTKLSVYHKERAELSVGDTIRINRNDPKQDLTNGDRMRVVSLVGNLVRLESLEQKDGRALRTLELSGSKPLHLEHSYASTVHSAQGLTNDRALIAIDTKSRTISMNLYYVAISRARYEARLYADSLSRLPGAISRRFVKTEALEVQRERELYRKAFGLKPKTSADGKSALGDRKKPIDGQRLPSGKF
ncbi:MobF family relaxase [Chromobacterium vaccinii]|uniref:MobF family relaxase n=1 Tax=Chromobacterium vaccinii TaxID=1108595 RepID=UPI00345A831B